MLQNMPQCNAVENSGRKLRNIFRTDNIKGKMPCSEIACLNIWFYPGNIPAAFFHGCGKVTCSASNIKNSSLCQMRGFLNYFSFLFKHQGSDLEINEVQKSLCTIIMRDIIIRFVISADILFLRILTGKNKSAFRAFKKVKFLSVQKMISAFEI